jgi:hypothetical protein
VGDKRALEGSLTAERSQTTFLRERVTELQRALMAFQDKGVAAQVVRHGKPDRPEDVVPERPNRWTAAAGTFRPGVNLRDVMVADAIREATTATAGSFKIVTDPRESM